ncbi:hypothetical protein [Nocardia pseudobrasiliensis]|uniref:Uncharacterized protein n=1 Tax=Nocardia pseudobrasiliensis TaxID=45979 RepID=A0A370I0V2_9NOCA|nr:hypothetical protein [Nocardia pseudobrasiliensis]RDI64346.1 hypothetical protein DFR76_108178 [Nocardia pseudobrasiliensis]
MAAVIEPHPGLEISKLPFLGTSWYTRGLSYRLRRAWLTFFILLMSAFPIWGVCIVFVLIISKATGGFRITLLAAAIAGVCWSFVLGYRSITRARQEERRLLAGQSAISSTSRPGSSGTAAGLGLGVAGLGGSALAGGLLLIGQLFVVGWLAMVVVKTLGHYLGPSEIRAVMAVRTWYDQHPDIPNAQRPKQFRR